MKPISLYNGSGYPDPTAYEALNHVEQELREARVRPIVFICCPISGHMERNLQNARKYSRFAADRGYLPLTPHLLFPQFMNSALESERWLFVQMSMILLTKCAELWAFGECVSKGMSLAIARARSKGQPIRFFSDDCKEIQ